MALLFYLIVFFSYLSLENYVKDLTHTKQVCENSRKNNVKKNLLVALW